jgi:hypothetical protein
LLHDLLQFSTPTSGDEQSDADDVWRAGMDKIEAAANAVDMPLAWTTQTRCPHTHRETAKSGLIS